MGIFSIVANTISWTPEFQKTWWGQAYVVVMMCLPCTMHYDSPASPPKNGFVQPNVDIFKGNSQPINEICKYISTNVLFNTRRACGPVDVGTCPHQALAATLTLSQPEGADYAHPILVSTPSFKATGAPEYRPNIQLIKKFSKRFKLLF